MDNEFLQTIVALLPFVILLLGFLVFPSAKADRDITTRPGKN